VCTACVLRVYYVCVCVFARELCSYALVSNRAMAAMRVTPSLPLSPSLSFP
jgi:hypothetical protein